MIAYHSWKVPYIGIIGREDMQIKYRLFGHPLFPYFILRSVGSAIQKLVSVLGIEVGPIQYVFFLRAALAILNISLIMFLAWACSYKIVHERNKFLFNWFYLALFSSVFFCLVISHMQYEAAGFLLVVTSLLFVISALYYTQSKTSQILRIVMGGLIFGLGKNEWSIVALLAIFLTLLLCRARFARVKCLQFLFGLVIGNCFSWLCGPANYLGGFDLINHFTFAQKSFYDLSSRVAYLRHFRLWFWKEIMLFIVSIFLVVIKIRKNNKSINEWFFWFSLLFTILLAAAILVASWKGDAFPRYFVICMPSFLIFFALCLKEEVPFALRRKLTLLCFCVFLLNLEQHFLSSLGYGSIFKSTRTSRCVRELKESRIDDSCIYVVPSGVGWYLPTLNFFHEDLTEKYMKHRKPLCSFECSKE
ncbi:hypothetical protein ACFL2J_04340 [Candidatus Omnitrophota bacterium]